MIRPYVGEYLVSPVPIHLGLNRCSHSCWYCFANLNKSKRTTDLGAVNRVLSAFLNDPSGDSRDISLMLLRKGFPVLISNDCDPFAKSNQAHFRMLFDALSAAGIPMTFQTKGGDGAAELLCGYRPTMVYVSLTTDDDTFSKKIEPGAPVFSERLKLIRALKKAGHFVVAGVNPFVPQWWSGGGYGLIDTLHSVGVSHVWMGELHLSQPQASALSPAISKRFAKEIKIGKMKKDRPDRLHIDLIKAAMVSAGINVFYGTTSEMGGFWDEYFALGFPFFPTIDGFLTHLASMGGPVAFDFDYFDRWANVAPGHRASNFKEYLCAFGRTLRNSGERDKARSFSEVHGWYWRILDFPTNLRHDSICVATGEDGGEVVVETSGGKDVFVYAPGGDDINYPLNECSAKLLQKKEVI